MAENKHPVIIGVGELLWDMLPEGKRAGGAPINFVYHATRLGAQGYAVSAVGNDALGDEILAELEKSGIKYCISRNDHPTGHVKVVLNDGIPSYDIVEGVAWDYLTASAEAEELVKRADAVCFGTLALRPSEKSWLPTPKVKVADTVGAGDSFSGAFVYNILTGKSLAQAHKAAVDVAAFVSTKSGAWPAYEKGAEQ